MNKEDRVVALIVTVLITFLIFAILYELRQHPRQSFSAPAGASVVISTTLYTPFVRHISPDACRTMFPADEVGALCDYYEGINLPDLCAPGYHLETQTTPGERDYTTRKVCHLDSARGERGAGLDCQKGAP